MGAALWPVISEPGLFCFAVFIWGFLPSAVKYSVFRFQLLIILYVFDNFTFVPQPENTKCGSTFLYLFAENRAR